MGIAWSFPYFVASQRLIFLCPENKPSSLFYAALSNLAGFGWRVRLLEQQVHLTPWRHEAKMSPCQVFIALCPVEA
jgi:hypothetical protein